MWKVVCKLSLILILSVMAGTAAGSPVQAAEPKDVQVFDIAQGKIMKRVKNSPEIREEVENSLQSIHELVVKFRVEPKDGVVLRIPMEPSVKVDNQWFHDSVNEVFIIVPRSEKPFMLLFTADKKSIILKFKHPVQQLLKEMKL
jgi:hypothetical protein